MKGLVLAGGRGTRLRPITHTSAKQLVPIANRPVIFYGLESLRSAGIHEVGIVVGDTAAEVRAAIGDGSAFGLRVTYLPQQAPMGLAHGVLIARDYLGEDDFVMYLGDNFIVGGIAETVRTFGAETCDARLLLAKVPDPTQFGVAEIDENGVVLGLAEKPVRPRSDLAVVGVYLFRASIHEAVRAIEPSDRGELEITDALDWLLRTGRTVRSDVITGFWKDTGRAADLLACNQIVLDGIHRDVRGSVDADTTVTGRVVIAPGARVHRSRLVGPLIIGPGTVVDHSYVGPFTSVGRDCTVTHSELEGSIVMDGSAITGIRRIQDSLIGRDVRVAPASGVAHIHRLVLGDHSQVELAV
ncbi:glucose-1-phosphate thymidylyltransferase [Nocardia acidivorans]|uniref:glucose-1-phosphate thymidylyltransferase n=1 Tax=Nocardia acidivorans TaxID=404580 RepID=UPI0008347B6B|nr:glucose-1-phosphate thymidylyltransferase [Nocardia acidivorans]